MPACVSADQVLTAPTLAPSGELWLESGSIWLDLGFCAGSERPVEAVAAPLAGNG